MTSAAIKTNTPAERRLVRALEAVSEARAAAKAATMEHERHLFLADLERSGNAPTD